MPLYTYECVFCQEQIDAYNSVENREEGPKCKCGGLTEKIITPTNIAPQFTPYKAVAGDQRMITSKQQHKNFLSENNLQEVGNDNSMMP